MRRQDPGRAGDPPVNYNIQALRALAALAVLFFHAMPFFEQVGGRPGVLGKVFGVGYLGVDLFFVISGFIIARGVSGCRLAGADFRHFVERRAYRIFLGYWPVLALACLYYVAAMPERLAQANPLATIFLLSHRITDLVIGQAWSLSFELYFYLLFGVLALTGRIPARMAVLVYAAVIVILNLRDPAVAKGFFANPHLLELFAGMLLGQANMPALPRRWLPALVLAATALFGLWLSLNSPTRLVTVSLAGGAALLLVLIAELRCQSGGNRPSLMSRLGDSSYALYLLHYLLLEIFVRHLGGIEWLRPILPYLFPFWLAAIVALAHAHYLWLERPLFRRACALRGLPGRGGFAGALR